MYGKRKIVDEKQKKCSKDLFFNFEKLATELIQLIGNWISCSIHLGSNNASCCNFKLALGYMLICI